MPLVIDNVMVRPRWRDELSYIELPLGWLRQDICSWGVNERHCSIGPLQNGTFYWQLGPGFLGDYPMVFDRPDGTAVSMRVRVRSGTNRPPEASSKPALVDVSNAELAIHRGDGSRSSARSSRGSSVAF